MDEQVSADTIKFPNAPQKKRQPYRKTSRHYFVIENGTMRSIERDTMEDAWQGNEPWPGPDGDVRILSVVHDETENIVGCFFLLVSVVNGKFVRESIEEAHRANMEQGMQRNGRKDGLLPGYARQVAGWPGDWPMQVATALGVEAQRVHDVGVGGPLLLSFTKQMSITKAAGIHAKSLRFLYGDTPKKTAHDEAIGSIEFSFESPLQPWDGDHLCYILEVAGKVKAIPPGKDTDEPETVGELKLLIIKLAEARKDGLPISEICDCHSGYLEEVYATMFADEEFIEEFGLASPSGDLVYIDEISLKPEYDGSPLLRQAIETAISAFASRGLVVANQSLFKDESKRWRKLGFREIPRSGLLVRSPKPRRLGF